MELILPPPITRHRINAEQFHKMAEVGMFLQGERVELIEGEIIDMAPIGSFHCGNVDWLNQTFFESTRIIFPSRTSASTIINSYGLTR